MPADSQSAGWRSVSPKIDLRVEIQLRLALRTRAEQRTMAPAGGTQTVSARAATWLAWSLSAVTLALLCAGLALWGLNGFPLLLGSNEATGGAVFRILAASTFALIAIVGLLIAKHQPTNPFGWLTLAAVLVSTLDLFSQNMGGNALEPWPAAARWIAAVAYPLNVSAGLVA